MRDKLIVLLIAVAVTVLIAIILTHHVADLYPMSGRVIYVDTETDTIQIKNCTGFVYVVEDADDWEKGDWCSCIMDRNGTANVADDKIIIIRYENVKEMQTW